MTEPKRVRKMKRENPAIGGAFALLYRLPVPANVSKLGPASLGQRVDKKGNRLISHEVKWA